MLFLIFVPHFFMLTLIYYCMFYIAVESVSHLLSVSIATCYFIYMFDYYLSAYCCFMCYVISSDIFVLCYEFLTLLPV